MATANTNTVIDHTSDAGFRAWRDEFISLLDTGGALVDTGDTGQVVAGVGARPGTNTDGGYVVRRYNDTAQATAPYFFRFDFGTGIGTDRPRVRMTIGTGSNGSGTITGVIQAALQIGITGAIASTATAYPSYACGHGGSFGLAFKCGASASGGYLYFGVHRVRALDGSQSEDGIVLLCSEAEISAAAGMRSYRRVSPTVFGGSQINSFCLIPLLTTTSVQPGGSPLAYRHFTAIPEQRPMLESMTVIQSEVGLGSTFTARPVGATDRTYVACGNVLPRPAAGVTGGFVYSLAMLYD